MERIAFISNSDSHTLNHQQAIADAMPGADEIVLCAAYWKTNAIDLFRPALKEALEKGKTVRIFASVNERVTEPEALVELLRLLQGHDRASFYLCKRNGSIFHSKVYYFGRGDAFTAVVGSANFTQGGMKQNDEVSIQITGPKSCPFHSQLKTYLDGLAVHEVSKPATIEEINAYIPEYNKGKRKKVQLFRHLSTL
jgi:HKD family nuclease